MNRDLAFGLAILACLCVIAAFSGVLAPHEEGYSKSLFSEVVDGETVLSIAPEPPGRHFVLGSDFWGHDLFSEMLHGLPWTLAVVFVSAVTRCLAGLILGLVSGSVPHGESRKRGFSPLSGVPGFILAAFVLYPVTINSTRPALELFALQAMILVLVEIGPVASSFRAKTALVFSKEFIDAARMAGAGRGWIIRRHLLPFLTVDFIEAIPIQTLSVAAMIGKLGILKVFIGGTIRTVDPLIDLPAHSEWLGLLGYYHDSMLNQPWLFFTPLAGWFLILACSLLLSSGLRKRFARARRIDALS